jgi:hypothetical protein
MATKRNWDEMILGPPVSKKQTAWEKLLPEYRSDHIGWSKVGDFYCPKCDMILGRNGHGEKPHFHASAHLDAHKKEKS